jgi:hypothetical protein
MYSFLRMPKSFDYVSLQRWVLAILLLVMPCFVVAAPMERAIGSGLVYVRVHTVPGDLPVKPVGRVPACIVDLRYVAADVNQATDFSAWLHRRVTPRSPVFVLANAETSSALLTALASHQRGTGIAVVGIERGAFRPDVSVKSSPEDERRAYEALEKGAALDTLLTDNPNKARNDEASLSKDRLAEASAEAADEPDKKTQPPVDAALQRAMHLHRALVAMKKI